jgi:F-type H+-transporting ATPase subunit epsilon
MTDTFELEIATPEKLVLREAVSSAQIPCVNGYIGVLPMHAPLMSELGEGELTFVQDGARKSLQIQGGYVEVLPDHVRVLAQQASGYEPAEA